MNTMVNIMIKSGLPRAGRLALPVFALLALFAAPAMADTYGYSGSTYGGHSYSNGYSYHSYQPSYHTSHPAPAPTATASTYQRRYHYTVGYRDGDGGFSWLGWRRGVDSSNGYSGANTFINRPHRADWNAKLNAQRRWDEDQFQQSQQAGGAACGYTTSPAYCYKLMGPYPSELKIVRY